MFIQPIDYVVYPWLVLCLLSAAYVAYDQFSGDPDAIWTARLPGKWVLHCHIAHHATNNNREEQGGGGLMLIVNVSP